MPRQGAATDITLRPPRISAGAAIALMWLIVAISFYIDPTILVRSQVGQSVEPWDYVWNSLYLVGGIAILVDRWHRHPAVGAEILGVCLLAAGWSINLLAVLYTQGFAPRVLVYAVMIWWGYSRYRQLLGRS